MEILLRFTCCQHDYRQHGTNSGGNGQFLVVTRVALTKPVAFYPDAFLLRLEGNWMSRDSLFSLVLMAPLGSFLTSLEVSRGTE